MAKFKVGDRARYIGVSKNPIFKIPVGAEVIITEINVIGYNGSVNAQYDYRISYLGDNNWACYEAQLEPIIDLGSWDEIQKAINWNPTKELNIESAH